MSLQLPPHPSITTCEGPVVLLILDGVGIGKPDDSNAWHCANTPFLDHLKTLPTYCELKAHGTAVGMPSDDDMGNSEVGHNTLGAGRIFDQGSALVKTALENKTLFSSETWKNGIHNCISNKSTLHLIGLLSDGNVHNHIDYQIKLINQAINDGITRIRLHCLLDGRDVPARSAKTYIGTLNKTLHAHQEKGIDIHIASGGGRMITSMDRYNADWRIVERGYNAHVHGIGHAFSCIEEAIDHAYQDPTITDQYIPPFVIHKNNNPIGKIQTNDTVFLTNFRGDRAIELSEAFEADSFTHFDRGKRPNVFFAGMMQYDGDRHIPHNFLIAPPAISKTLGEYFTASNIKTLALSETQKFGHVTYFWNGNKSGYLDKTLENYIEILSDTIPFDQKPDMKAHEITSAFLTELEKNTFDFARINFPNGDMVGHTGNFKATVQTMETVDTCVKQIVEAINAQQGITVILADHGNADEMHVIKDGKKEIKTAHSLNPVPFAILDSRPSHPYKLNLPKNPGLANVASTLCNLLGYISPTKYEESLIKSI
ncbi:2,3-bisphosphoglycerate-independent phosphoglycerate mutase [bacterium]|nr:2,3-bisphosphoglycerate-independent phosphoglycerate mutase [bacterium]